MKKIIALAVVVFISLIAFIWVLKSLTHVAVHECAYGFNNFDGEVSVIERSGWIFKPWPKYSVQTIDTRPFQISITADLDVGQRVLNAKLVRFNPEGVQEFVSWHGFGAGGDSRKLSEIMKCYAFDRSGGKNCPFIEILDEIQPEQGPVE